MAPSAICPTKQNLTPRPAPSLVIPGPPAKVTALAVKAASFSTLRLLKDELALRLNYVHSNDPGYIDYAYLVKQPGVSLPDPDWSDAAAVGSNIKKQKDANGAKSTNIRASLRWKPTDAVDINLNYYRQQQDFEGRSIVHYGSLAQSNPLHGLVGKYESAYRYPEFRDKTDELLSLEITADLGFAELVSATGKSEFEALGQRDQTDLLTRLNFGYEAFPSFAAYTREEDKSEALTQELRLVSQTDGPLSWIVGGYYNKAESDGVSKEFTPGFAQFALDAWSAPGNDRPDSLEYISVGTTEQVEKAIFGELSYEVNDDLVLTVGTRFYDYKVESNSAIDTPLYNSVFGGAPGDQISLNYKYTESGGDGNLLKFNVSYDFSDDVMGYLTVSEGFRIGGSNGAGPCPDNIDQLDQQIVCALPNELHYGADTTANTEIGFKTRLVGQTLELQRRRVQC